MGELFKGQKKQLALFGTSSSFYNVPYEKNWPALISIKNEGIHIDNFSYFSQNLDNLNKHLKSLCRLKRSYNIVIIQIDLFYAR